MEPGSAPAPKQNTAAAVGPLPKGLADEAEKLMKKIRAQIGTAGDPSVMDSFIESPSITTVVLITLLLSLGAYIIAEIANYNDIVQNWSQYQCMPSIAPFAEFYGKDLKQTLNFCVAQNVKEHAGSVINPIYQGINEVTGVVEGVYDKVVAIEGGVSSLLSGFESFVINFVNSFRLVGTRIRMSVVRIKDIFGRVFGLFMAFVYAGLSALTFGENIACNSLVLFLATIGTGSDRLEQACCFAPEMQVVAADGAPRAIRDICIGDVLAGGSIVTSTYLFSGTGMQMVDIKGIHVSTNHYVQIGGDRFVQAGQHPDASPAAALPYLWCLGTSDNRIPVLCKDSVLMFTDYEESSDPAVIAEAQAIAEMTLNGVIGPTVSDYSLGLDPGLLVYMRNGTWIPIEHVKVGAQLMSGAVVVGLIRELCETLCESPGGSIYSAAQLIHHGGVWRRAAHIWPARDQGPTILRHLLTDSDAPITVRSCSEILNVRDYGETNGTQTPYDTKLNALPPT